MTINKIQCTSFNKKNIIYTFANIKCSLKYMRHILTLWSETNLIHYILYKPTHTLDEKKNCLLLVDNNHIQHFYIVAKLQAMATFRIMFSVPKNHLYCRFEEVGLTNTGSKRSKTLSTQMTMASNVLLRVGKTALQARRQLKPTQVHVIQNQFCQKQFQYPCTCVIKYNSYKDFLTDSLPFRLVPCKSARERACDHPEILTIYL